ncbi:MAG: hypothetical protein AABZ06_14855, partial [Bdellovibrionota bacterium]
DKLVESDSRKYIFRLEALSRLYRDHPTLGEGFNRLLGFFKQFEDSLGAYVDAKKTAKKADELGVSQEIVKLLSDHAQQKHHELVAYLKTSGWADGSSGQFLEMQRFLEGVSWYKQKVDRLFLLGVFSKELSKIESITFNMRDLQGGVHELRRRLRWILIDIQSLRGKVEIIDDKPPKALKPLLDTLEEPNKYGVFEISDGVKKRIKIRKSFYQALNALVTRLGELKDDGELIEALAHAYVKTEYVTGRTVSEVQAMEWAKQFSKLDSSRQDFYPEASKLYKILQDSELLKKLRTDLEGQM